MFANPYAADTEVGERGGSGSGRPRLRDYPAPRAPTPPIIVPAYNGQSTFDDIAADDDDIGGADNMAEGTYGYKVQPGDEN